MGGDEAVIGVGRKVNLRLYWHPLCFSLPPLTSKEMEANPFLRLQRTLEQLDIKYDGDYNASRTSHLIVKKRNTATGLEALIDGNFIVTEAYMDAVAKAATPTTDTTDENEFYQCPLEQDFEGNWPDPLQFLPPRGSEPTQQSHDAYLPDDRRKEIFDGYTFVFMEKGQYSKLMPVICAGKGKALLSEVTPGQTPATDFIAYVKNVAGEKGLGEFEDGSEGKGVALVRFIPPDKDKNAPWWVKFVDKSTLR